MIFIRKQKDRRDVQKPRQTDPGTSSHRNMVKYFRDAQVENGKMRFLFQRDRVSYGQHTSVHYEVTETWENQYVANFSNKN